MTLPSSHLFLSRLRASRRTLVGLLLCAFGLVLIIQPAGAQGGILPYLPTGETADDDLGTGSNDLSGATYNQLRDRVLVVDNGTDRIHEFATDASGAIVTPARRTITLSIGDGDTEGIAWIAGDDYAVLSEDAGTIELITVPDGDVDIDIDSSFNTLETFIPEDGGITGAEGIAVDYNESNGTIIFWVTKEKDPLLYKFDSNGAGFGVVTVPVLDASGVYASPVDDTIFVVSDESEQIVQLDVDPLAGTATVLSTMDLPLFEQAEGITFSTGMASMYIFGESPTDGLTYARFQPPAPTPTPTPTSTPTPTPTPTPEPTATPTPEPTATPTPEPTATPTPEPTATPTPEPTATPTPEPTATPMPTTAPTSSPTVQAITAPSDPGSFSQAPAVGNGAFGFGLDPEADTSAAGTGGGDATSGIGTQDGATAPGLVATGRTNAPTVAVGLASLLIGSSLIVSSRRSRS
ncbi:MAG: SdiA-regulated domain-containing protein [Actinomycetota bacterium]